MRRPPLLALCLVMTVAGCGGHETLSKAELIRRGDAICSKSNKELEPIFGKVFKKGEGNPSAEEAAPVLTEAAKIVRRQYERFAALKPRQSEERQFKRFVENFKTTVKLLDDSVAEAKKGSTDGYLKQLRLADEADSSTSKEMASFGFKACAGAASA